MNLNYGYELTYELDDIGVVEILHIGSFFEALFNVT